MRGTAELFPLAQAIAGGGRKHSTTELLPLKPILAHNGKDLKKKIAFSLTSVWTQVQLKASDDSLSGQYLAQLSDWCQIAELVIRARGYNQTTVALDRTKVGTFAAITRSPRKIAQGTD